MTSALFQFTPFTPATAPRFARAVARVERPAEKIFVLLRLQGARTSTLRLVETTNRGGTYRLPLTPSRKLSISTLGQMEVDGPTPRETYDEALAEEGYVAVEWVVFDGEGNPVDSTSLD